MFSIPYDAVVQCAQSSFGGGALGLQGWEVAPYRGMHT